MCLYVVYVLTKIITKMLMKTLGENQSLEEDGVRVWYSTTYHIISYHQNKLKAICREHRNPFCVKN